MASTEPLSEVLVIGGTGHIGKFIVDRGQRPRSVSLLGDLYDHESLVKAIRAVDVVISAVGYLLLEDQKNIILAIKEAGNVKRFFPSEFGNDADRVCGVEPTKSMYAIKAQIRRAIVSEGIPYTFFCCNLWAGRFLQVDGIGLLLVQVAKLSYLVMEIPKLCKSI
ncbi:hypothetical protein LUZ63_015601 [Rhynchospora breviuscula]|uniref:NmrA-like domain-containing protein n=1 Tax=Rhynchospora breviuscula TaxID=2022672 RepID=A0A9Q0CCN0_9POAL|nr:hypothetical protein LUZ63_015601 [Rhynchospora breviuscula]